VTDVNVTYSARGASAINIADGNITVTKHSTGLYVESIKISNQCATDCLAGTYVFVITGMKNPDYVSNLVGNFTIDTVDADQGIVNRGRNTTSVGNILPHLIFMPAYD